MPELFHFLQPHWFWALLPLLLVFWLLRRPGDGDTAWRRVCDARLLPYLLVSPERRVSRLPLWLLAAGWLLAVIALADPVWEKQDQPVFRNQAARVVVLDLSNSMLSPDLKPSRLVRARYKVADILRQNNDGQTGLVVFAGDAFAVSPLTSDADTIQALLSPLEPALMPSQGSRVDLGLERAGELLKQAGIRAGEILLVTDGFHDRRALDVAEQLHADGYRLSILGVGTEDGAPVPTGRGGFLRDNQDRIVVPQLDQTALQELAAAGGGSYITISSGDSDIKQLLRQLQPGIGDAVEETEMSTDSWQSNGPLLALLLLPLAALVFRRGWLLVLLVMVSVTGVAPKPAMAYGWEDLWLRKDQQAARALQEGEPAQAAQLARDPNLRGTAEYQAGNFDQAVEAFEGVAGADAEYNQGNSLANLGRYEEAIAAYERALSAEPDMDDAIYNKDAVERLLQQQQQQEEQQEQQGDPGQDGDDQQSGNEGEQDGESRQDQPNQSGENGEQGSESEPGQQSADAQDEGQNPSEQQEARQAEQHNGDEEQGAEQSESQTAEAKADPLDSEERQAAEQWLRRIPDDPGGLLRRKFLYQYRQRAGSSNNQGQPEW
jgi:Ca-activated chloride channel family protein